jgi:hypothetical protein
VLARTAGLFAFSIAFCLAAEQAPPSGEASNNAVQVTAKLYNGKDDVRQIIGSDLDGDIVVVDVTVTPKTGKSLAVHLDDFMLRSDKDGERARPFEPSQIAGRGALVISYNGSGGPVMSEDQGPVFGGGGYPGGGQPRRLGGNGGMMGNTASESTAATVQSGTKEKDDPLLATLKEKVLPEGEVSKPVSGLLYFLMEGKHKDKQLEFYYQGPAGKLSMRFRR